MHCSDGSKRYTVGCSRLWSRSKEVIFIELILDTYRSPHIGSKLCFAKGTQLISSLLSVLQSLEVSYRQWRIRHLEFLGSSEALVLVWGVGRLLDGGSGLTSPLGSVLSQCTARHLPTFAV